jgi:hypothetical protein
LELHCNNMTREDCLTLSASWKPLLCLLRDSRWYLSRGDRLMALLEAPTSIFLPHTVTTVSIPQLRSMVDSLPDIFPSWAWAAFLTLVLCVCFLSFFSPSHFLFYCCFLSLLPFPLLFTHLFSSSSLSPFFVSCYFI